MTATYKIAELAREFAITTRTIRHYEEEGLLNPGRQGVNRVFSSRDRVRLKLALRGKRLGFSLQEIKELFELYDMAKDERRQLEAFLDKREPQNADRTAAPGLEVLPRKFSFFCDAVPATARSGAKNGTGQIDVDVTSKCLPDGSPLRLDLGRNPRILRESVRHRAREIAPQEARSIGTTIPSASGRTRFADSSAHRREEWASGRATWRTFAMER